MTVVGYAPGVYDVFHVGHLNILKHARSRCDYLVAGVLTDEVAAWKGRSPIVPLIERLEIVRSVRYVDEVVVDHHLDKIKSWHEFPFDVMFKGDDWRGTPKAEHWERTLGEVGARVVYFPYTAHTSSTTLRQLISDRILDHEVGG